MPDRSGTRLIKLLKQESPCIVRSAVKPSACENVAKKSHLSVTFEKNVEVFRRMEDGQTHRDVCKGLQLVQSTVRSKMTGVDTVRQCVTAEVNISKKFEKLLSLRVDDKNFKKSSH